MDTLLNHNELKYLLIDSLKAYSEDTAYIDGNNPYTFSINKKTFHILIKNVSDSGEGRSNPDECRIQFSNSQNFLAAKNSGKPVLFLGYSNKEDVFTAWNPYIETERINNKTMVSVYSRFSIIQKAMKQGIAVYVDSNGQIIISFKSSYLGLYLENFSAMHQSSEATLLELIKSSDVKEETTEDVGAEVSIGREKFIINHKRFKRDEKFRRIIKELYDSRCAFCGIQLDLVEAAHIIPFSDEKGIDDPKNGICLCALHHTAYDTSLIYVDENYSILVNEEKKAFLIKVGRDGGLTKFLPLQFTEMRLPSSSAYNPSKEFIKSANNIRGITN